MAENNNTPPIDLTATKENGDCNREAIYLMTKCFYRFVVSAAVQETIKELIR